MTALVLLTVAAMGYTLVGCVTFLAMYRPSRPCPHDVSGTNAAPLLAWVGVLAATGLAAAFLPMPEMVVVGLQLGAFSGMGTVVWIQVLIVFRARREQ